MRKIFPRILLVAGLVVSAGSLYAGAQIRAADEAPEQVDPKKKKAGEECKTSDECQSHHTCSKSGDKNICVAPPRPKLPPGVVT